MNCLYDYSNKREYEEIIWNKTKKIGIFRGLFQSAKYFDFCKSDIVKEFQLKNDYYSDENKQFLQLIERTNSVCLHIRRGDYLTSPEHCVCGKKYYINAIEIIKRKLKNAKFFVFSDDIGWAKENFKGEDFIFSENNPDYIELSMMAMCKHFIISNSTFSWWAQYLSNFDQKIVIAPSKWKMNQNNKDDYIYQDDWILVDVSK